MGNLSLDGNQLTGPIPPTFGKLTKLTHLYMYQNQLSGEIPEEPKGCKSMIEFRLHKNQLSGVMPPAWLGPDAWPNLDKFFVADNADMKQDKARLEELQKKADGGD